VLEEIADEMDTTGIERVKQALYAHHWPNLKAKCILLKITLVNLIIIYISYYFKVK